MSALIPSRSSRAVAYGPMGLMVAAFILTVVAGVEAQSPPRATARQPQVTAPRPGTRAPRPQPAPQPRTSTGTPGQPPAPRLASRAGQPSPPAEFRLPAAEQQQLDEILKTWEERNRQIDKFRCTVTRYEFDPVWGPPEAVPYTIARGEIRYSAPDRGLFQINGAEMRQYRGQDEQGKPQYQADKEHEIGEKWICDGESIYEFRADQKVVVQTKLPVAMRGQAISDGPLPFLFGASAEKLKARYWIRELRSPESVDKKQIWLEAAPRHAEEAVDFRVVRIAFNRKFEPLFMEVEMHHTGDVQEKKSYVPKKQYIFSDVRINSPLDDLKEFAGKLINTDTPRGWQKIVEDYRSHDAAAQQAAQPAPNVPHVGARSAGPCGRAC